MLLETFDLTTLTTFVLLGTVVSRCELVQLSSLVQIDDYLGFRGFPYSFFICHCCHVSSDVVTFANSRSGGANRGSSSNHFSRFGAWIPTTLLT